MKTPSAAWVTVYDTIARFAREREERRAKELAVGQEHQCESARPDAQTSTTMSEEPEG